MGNKTQKSLSGTKFKKLVHDRNRLSWFLTIVVLLAYYGFIAIIAFDKELFALKIGEGVMTLGIPVALALMVLIIVLTGVYVLYANNHFDKLTKAAVEEIEAGDKHD